jgi:hypothetical protein
LVASYKEIAEFLSMMTYAKDQDDSSELTDIQRPRPLNSWDTETWMAAHDAIKHIHDRLLRHDANFTLEQLEQDGHNDQQNLELVEENAFGIGFNKLLKYFLFHSCLSPFRLTLENSIKEDMGKKSLLEPLVVSHEFLLAYRYVQYNENCITDIHPSFVWNFLCLKICLYAYCRTAVASCEDEMIRNAMSRLLAEEGGPFRTTDDVSQFLNDREKIFSYEKLMQRTNSLLRKWLQLALGEPRSTVRHSSNRYVGKSFKQRHHEEIKHLQDSRARLNKRVVDPLPEVAMIAQKARRLRMSSSVSTDDDDEHDDDQERDHVFKEGKQSHKRKILERKPSATRFEGMKDDEEEIIDETDESSADLDVDDDNDDNSSKDGHQVSEERKEIRTGKFLEQNISATIFDFHSDDEEEIIEGRVGGKADRQIKVEPTHKKPRKSQQKTYEGRRTWTEIEIYAVKEGIAAFGWGKWALIKDYYNAILKNRTSSQIKVRRLGNE